MSRPWIQWLFIPVAALALFLVWDFAQRGATYVRLAELEQQKQQQLAHAQATRAVLSEDKKDAASDERTERIARGWGWVKPGDTLVRTPPTPTAIPIAPARPAAPAAKSWLDALYEFFGLK